LGHRHAIGVGAISLCATEVLQVLRWGSFRAAMNTPLSVVRHEHLRDHLPGTVDALRQRRADLVPEGFIADYVALDWLEWNGGSLRITLTGANICKQVRAGLR
jgi:hypothetical protein